jgi:hypothetical protein
LIDPATLMMWGDAIDEAGRFVLFAVLLAFVIVGGGLTAALFLGLAIRRAGRIMIRRFASGKI